MGSVRRATLIGIFSAALVVPAADRAQAGGNHRARVFDVSPLESELEEVVFTDLPEDATSLEDSEIRVLNCIDRRSCQDVRTNAGVRNLHHCELEAKAAPGSDGSFLHVKRPSSDRSAEDAFAEVQAYYHTKKAAAYFRGLDPTLVLPRLTVVVNMRPPDVSDEEAICTGDTARPKSKLLIEENAYYWPAQPPPPGPVSLTEHRIVLHQTRLTDWAYDGEVVYHEYTHAVMFTLSQMGQLSPDPIGTSPEPGALHEAFSDYFSGAITGNGQLALYAGTDDDGPQPIGDLTLRSRCTSTLSGEPHDEAAAMMTALWAIRVSLRSAARREMFDRAMLRVVAEFGRDQTFEGAVDVVLAEMEAAGLGDAVADAGDKFAERDLPGCNGRIARLVPGKDHAFVQLAGPNSFGGGELDQFVPAPVQFELVVKKSTDAIRFSADASFQTDATIKNDQQKVGPDLVMLVKPAEPIRWQWNQFDGEHDADLVIPVRVFEDEDGRIEAIAERAFPAGSYFIQIANRGEDWAIDTMRFSVRGPDGEFSDKADGGGAPSAGAGCATSGTGGSPLAVGLIAVAIAASRRRRRR